MIFLFKSILIKNDYISIPFKKYHSSINIPSATDKFIKDYLNNNIYTYLQISEPLQNISAKINIFEFELLMKNVKTLPLDNLNSYFSKDSSSSFSIISEKGDRHFPKSKFAKDSFNFCVNYDIKNRQCKCYKNDGNINLIYSEDDESEDEDSDIKSKFNKYTFIEIGLNFKSYYNLDKYSLLTNLIKNQYITNNNWFIHFYNKNINNNNNNDNNDDNENRSYNDNFDEGILVFGIDPVEFFDSEYNKNNVSSCQGINKNYDYKNNWSIIFNELKQRSLKSDNKEFIIQKNVQGVINFNYDVIVGNNQYMDIISKTFFWPYITKEICQQKLANNKFYYFVCNSLSLNFNEIKENFPILYFKQNEFDYVFELTAHDLFVQIGDKIFFLIVFNKNNPTSSFLLGNIFLKKYFFSFDNNLKTILFYKKENKKKAEIVVLQYNSSKIIAISGFLIVIFLIIGLYFGKRIYQKRKLRANELEDAFCYPQKDIDKNFNMEEI